MKQAKTLKLIDGDFTTEEALEVLNNLIKNKIKFHELKIFSHSERYGDDDTYSYQRIKELKASLEELRTYLNIAKENNMKIKINAEVSLNMVMEKKEMFNEL